MLANFNLFCICALLRTINAAAKVHLFDMLPEEADISFLQLEFGTYEIVSQASQSNLCSYDAGGPVYVSTHGLSCGQGLWELGPGDDHDLYTIKNIGLNSYVRASEILASSVLVTSNGKTSFKISPIEGRDYIIKFPDGDLVWTVTPTTIFHASGDILLLPESGNETQLWTLVPTNDKTGHIPLTEFGVQARYSKEEERNLVFLRDIEKLGGSAGYRKFLESPRTIPNSTHITTLISNTFTNSAYASGSLESVIIYTVIEVSVGEYVGQGHAWGAGTSGIGFIGTFWYNSWDELLSVENDITITGVVDTFIVLFSVNNHDVAKLTLAGLGVGALLGARGSFVWTRI